MSENENENPTAPIPVVVAHDEAGDSMLDKVIGAVATIGVLCVLGIITLAILERSIPDVLENVTVASVTGLVALLAGRSRA